MGGSMFYYRFILRNHLEGDYDPENSKGLIAGDLRRLERDQRDDYNLGQYAKKAGITKEQVKIVLDQFFGV